MNEVRKLWLMIDWEITVMSDDYYDEWWMIVMRQFKPSLSSNGNRVNMSMGDICSDYLIVCLVSYEMTYDDDTDIDIYSI